MANLILYPVGAGGNFLLSLLGESQQASNNEYVGLAETKLTGPSDIEGKCDKYEWFRTHNPHFLSEPCFKNIYTIYTRRRSVQLYCNVLGALKINLNRNNCPNIEERIHRKWTDFTVDKYIPYEKIFFDLDLDDTLWAGREQDVQAYTERNIELLHEHGYSSFIPKR